MGSLNRDERQTLRSIQEHLRAAILEDQAVTEQLGTVDIFFHLSNPEPRLNCATPHKGVAWIRREDLLDGFAGLERLGRIPRLAFFDALFPIAFQQQLLLLGLSLEADGSVMVYRPMIGPSLPDETPLGRISEKFDAPITTSVASTRAELSVWLRVFRAGYYNTELLTVEPADIDPLEKASNEGKNIFVLASYEGTILGAARVELRPPTAQLDAVATAPLWHGMGLEEALISTASNTAMDRGCDTIFTASPPDSLVGLYRRLGFIDLTRMLTFWRQEKEGA